MEINGEDYQLTNDGESMRWDLRLMKTVRPRGGPERQELGDPMYGMPLENAIKIIINYRLDKKKDTYTLKEYLDEYKKQVTLLRNILKSYEK